MAELSEEEISLLEQLAKCEQTMSGAGARRLQRLIDEGWVKEQTPDASDKVYRLTELGRAGLRYQRPTPAEIPANELNASNDE